MKKFSLFATLLAFAAVGCGDTSAPPAANSPATVAENSSSAPTSEGASAAADVILVTLSVPEMT